MTQVWAHRGASAYAPENTLAAFQKAVEIGANGIELDVHRTRDGEIVVNHDETIERCSDGTGFIRDRTLTELLRYNFAKLWPQYPSQEIPTLARVLQLMKPTNLTVNIELKSGLVQYPGIEEQVVSLVQSHGMSERVVYSSFNHYSLLLVRKIDPKAYVGIAYQCGMVDPWVYAKHLGASAIHPVYPSVWIPGVVEGTLVEGIEVNAWTVDKYEDCLSLATAGVNAIITNRPDVALKAVADSGGAKE